MIKYLETCPVASILVFVLLMLGFTIDVLPVSIMEARNFITAREMLTDDNWILTTMNGEPRYEKPPLPTWITALFGFVFGIGKIWALRLPTLLLLSCVGIYTHFISRKLGLKNSASLINGFIAVTSFYVIAITIEAPWDIYAHGFMIMALYYLFQLLKSGHLSFKSSLLFVVLLACSVLSKGPVSIYVLLLSFLLAFAISYGYKSQKLLLVKVLGLIILGLAIGGSWYLYVRYADPDTFNRIASKETSNWSSYNVRPFYYYWSFFIQSGVWALLALTSLAYPFIKLRVEDLKAYRMTFFWTIFAVVLLSVIPEKKSRYLMPVLIPLALNLGFYMHYIIKHQSIHFKNKLPALITFSLVALAACLFWVLSFAFEDLLTKGFVLRFILSALVLMTIGILMFKHIINWNPKALFYCTILVFLSIGLLGLPLVNLKASSKKTELFKIQDTNLPVYSYGYVAPELIFAYGNKLPSIDKKNNIKMPEVSSFLVISNEKDLISNAILDRKYHIERIDELDFNTFEPGDRNYRKRLLNEIYRFTKR